MDNVLIVFHYRPQVGCQMNQNDGKGELKCQPKSAVHILNHSVNTIDLVNIRTASYKIHPKTDVISCSRA